MHLKFSQDLESLLARLATQPLTLGDVLAQTSERGFSLAIGLLVLPFLLPVPPGLTGVCGSTCFLLAVQMALGKRLPWLPQKVTQFQFPRPFILQLLKKLQQVSTILEKFVRPRLLWIAQSPHIWRWNGLCMAWLTVLLMLPIPLTNPIPTLGILLLAIATIEDDGLLMCVSYGLTAAITLFFVVLTYTIFQAPNWLPSIL